MAQLSARVARARSLLGEYATVLQQFTSSSSGFRVVHTYNPSQRGPKTLYILDSSFNPPSIAHLSLATAALSQRRSIDEEPFRLLLLFSTHNADKAAAPASYEHRLTMMTLFAVDLWAALHNSSTELSIQAVENYLSIDVGITNAPYYTDKTAAIEAASVPMYQSRPRHIHLLGYDTFERFLASKYYQNFDPPLSALAAYFNAGHKLRVTRRPDGGSETQGEVDMWARLRSGDLEAEGGAKLWADQITMVEPEPEAQGVSSTKVRRAARENDWGTVSRLCTPGVASWVKEMNVYKNEQ